MAYMRCLFSTASERAIVRIVRSTYVLFDHLEEEYGKGGVEVALLIRLGLLILVPVLQQIIIIIIITFIHAQLVYLELLN